MANTVTDFDGILNITFDGATDYSHSHAIAVESMLFVPTAIDDIITVRDKSTTGQLIVELKFADAYDHRFLPFINPSNHKQLIPHIKAAEVSAGVKMILFYG